MPQWAQTRVTGSPPHFAAVGAWRPRNLAPPVLAAGEDPAAAIETLAAANPAGLDIVDEGADATEDLCLGELPPHRLRYGLDQGVGGKRLLATLRRLRNRTRAIGGSACATSS